MTVLSFPEGGRDGAKDAAEHEVMILLGEAADKRFVKLALIGVDGNGESTLLTNCTEIEAVAMHESAKLTYFFEP